MLEARVEEAETVQSSEAADGSQWEPVPAFSASGRFWWGLLALTVLALTTRVLYATLWKWHFSSPGFNDVDFYRTEALKIAEGIWYPNFYINASNHPPLFGLVLSATDVARLMTYGEQLLFVAFLGTIVVFVVGLIGRQIAGDRAGLIAAAVAALYPGFWLQGSRVMPEPLAMVTVAVTILACYSLIRKPAWSRAVWVGVGCGLAALTRSELVLLLPLAVWPMIGWLRQLPIRQRLWLAIVASVAMLVVMTPWMASNVLRFHEPELLSTQAGVTLAGSNCPNTYYGSYIGYWSLRCAEQPDLQKNIAAYDIALAHVAERYAIAHLTRLPDVIWAREGRAWGFYKPSQQARLNALGEDGWNLTAAHAQVWFQYVIVGLAAAGVVVLRRKRAPLSPLVGVIVLDILVVALFYADPRFLSSGQVALVVLSGVAIDAGVREITKRRSVRTGAVESEHVQL